MALLFLGVAYHTGLHRNVPLQALAEQITKWLMGGAYYPRPINDYKDTNVLMMGVTWTLHFEWLFYASLLPLSIFARSRKLGTVLPIIGYVCVVTLFAFRPEQLTLPWAAFFLIGMTQGALQLRLPKGQLINIAASIAMLALLAMVFLVFRDIRAPLPITTLGAIFFLITSGTTFFGLLTTKAAVRLGDISYGIYLLQGAMLAIVFSIPAVRTLALGSPLAHWSISIICALLLIIVAVCAHVLIERKGVDAGRRLLRSLGVSRQGRVIPQQAG
jgi:peptidoglycan/LPS O-acetylase OafA/YrhL